MHEVSCAWQVLFPLPADILDWLTVAELILFQL